ncbi:Adenylate cyclase 2 [Labrenzia sp. THAF191b]|nr:Adenylate cyclase 2 [Labrenzia sp. THAF191b]QFT03118.1 Adenylate cyclase 2 [Labrenzia sp. THAF191a]QFT14660.1 Adenylate cyclase 2 [Labrenzia sp. THAF187b]
MPVGKTLFNLLRNRHVFVLGLTLILLFGARELRLSDPPFIASLRWITFDTYQRFKPREALGQPIRIIDIDEMSIAQLGQWPWPRTQIAKLLERIQNLGAACAAFDMVFSEPDRTGPAGFLRELEERGWPGRDAIKPLLSGIPDNDAVFVQSMAGLPTILGFFNEPRSAMGLPDAKAAYVVLGEDPIPLLDPIRGSVMSLPPYQAVAEGSGTISLGQADSDGVVRQVPMFIAGLNGEIYPALALETLRVALGDKTFVLKTSEASGEFSAGTLAMTEFKVGEFQVPVTANGHLLIYYTRNDPSLYLSARDLLNLSDEELAPLIEGHIILFGSSAAGLRDIRLTALGESVPGVFMHQQIIDQILSNSFLNRPDWATGAEIAALFIVTLIIGAILPSTGAIPSAAVGAVLSAAVSGGSWFAFSSYGLLLDPVFPMLVSGLIFLLTTILMFAFAEREKRFVRRAFQRYLAPDLLRKLEEQPHTLRLGGEIRDMTMMFMDVRGFTPISENLPPEDVVAFLNRLLSPLSECIQKREGAIDKYIGDSIMAFWNAPLDVADHPVKAAHAALDMIKIVKELNDRDAFGFKSGPHKLGDVHIGIGLNSGPGCVGNMGSSSRFNYSVIGDAVNVASRIEASCKQVGWPILLSQTTATACKSMALLEAGSITLKGKAQPATLYALVGDETLACTNEWQALVRRHRELIEGRSRVASRAEIERLVNACLAVAPVDLSAFYDSFMPSPIIEELAGE